MPLPVEPHVLGRSTIIMDGTICARLLPPPTCAWNIPRQGLHCEIIAPQMWSNTADGPCCGWVHPHFHTLQKKQVFSFFPALWNRLRTPDVVRVVRTRFRRVRFRVDTQSIACGGCTTSHWWLIPLSSRVALCSTLSFIMSTEYSSSPCSPIDIDWQ